MYAVFFCKGKGAIYQTLLIIGGILGTWWRIEDGILSLGDALKRTFARRDTGKDFAFGFLIVALLVGEGFARSHHLLGM